ncbi:MAG: thiol:disulfide interchange protein DsbA/DsbL [Arenimonas sp.]|nr:thiol:disulfide interchange protein DsbA/DsbL [Arenimonas sp.]
MSLRFRLTVLLGLLLPAAAFAAPPAPASAPKAGSDYHVIEGGAPLAPLAGQVEVVEVFGYWCHHCADFQPKLEAWKRGLPKDVRLTYLPMPSGEDDALARGFFASQAAGTLARTHEATYAAIHETGMLPRQPTADEVAAFYGQLGLDAARLKSLMDSPATAARLRPAWEFATRSGVEGTPTLIVNGRYRIDGGSLDQRLRVADQLVARERAAARGR